MLLTILGKGFRTNLKIEISFLQFSDEEKKKLERKEEKKKERKDTERQGRLCMSSMVLSSDSPY